MISPKSQSPLTVARRTCHSFLSLVCGCAAFAFLAGPIEAATHSPTGLFAESTPSPLADFASRSTTIPNLARFGSVGDGVTPALSLQVGGVTEAEASSSSPNRKAILYSILLPGLAHYDLGHKTRGTGFMVAELAFWTGFAVYRVQGENREESYVEMAELFAGLPADAKSDDDFYKLIAGWPSSDLYNEIIVRREARIAHPDDPAAREEYFMSNQLTGAETWDWQSNAARLRYREKRNEAQSSFKQSRNMVGLAVANRLVSMIDAVLLSNRLRNSSYGFEIGPDFRDGELTTRFALERRLP